jgi:hypothetical protein
METWWKQSLNIMRGACLIFLYSLSHSKKTYAGVTLITKLQLGSSIIYFLVVPQRMLTEQNQLVAGASFRLSFVYC